MSDNKERFYKVIQWLLENPKEQTSTAVVGTEVQVEAQAEGEAQESDGGRGLDRGSDRDSGK
jgi:hypothetical protein